MNRGRDRRQVKLDDQQHYKELEESHDAKASEEISYTTSLSELFGGGLLAEDGSRHKRGDRR